MRPNDFQVMNALVKAKGLEPYNFIGDGKWEEMYDVNDVDNPIKGIYFYREVKFTGKPVLDPTDETGERLEFITQFRFHDDDGDIIPLTIMQEEIVKKWYEVEYIEFS